MKGLLHLPRVCGGVPFPYCISFFDVKFTPRSRGCSRRTALLEREDRIYPAHAGMSPCLFCAYFKEFNLPRACGGVPWRMVCPPPAYTFTPRSRGGCSPCALLLTIYTPIYPALARMSPNSNHIFDHCGYLPRARGDVSTNSDATEHVDAICPTHVCAPHVKNRTNEFLVISQLPMTEVTGLQKSVTISE